MIAYCYRKIPFLKLKKQHLQFSKAAVSQILQYSLLTCLQQSIMNFGILMVQGLVNSFGVAVMAAFAAAVKIDSFAYMPVQDFGNAFSTFIAQNYGAAQKDRIRRGIRTAVLTAVLFCIAISLIVCRYAGQLMTIFIRPEETEIISIGVQYLRIEGICYCGIGCLFLLYGLYRGCLLYTSTPSLSIPLVGSSATMIFGSAAIPMASMTLCAMPPDISKGYCSITV